MPSYIDDAIAGAGRMGDDVVASIRRLLGYDTPDLPPGSAYTQPPVKGKPGGAVRGAVQSNDVARARQAAQAQRIGLMSEPAAAIDDTFKARDAAGPIVAATGALAGAGLVGSVADKVKKSYEQPAAAPKPALSSTGGTAELVGESRPAPSVTAEPDTAAAESEAVKRNLLRREMQRADAGVGAYDPRHQAEVLIKDLNNRRMKAGGEVPEAKQMLAQINDLLSRADTQRNSRSAPQAQAYAQSNPDDYHAKASAMLADLNARAKAMGGTPPDMQQTLAEVRRLQALGDEQRNSRTTARR